MGGFKRQNIPGKYNLIIAWTKTKLSQAMLDCRSFNIIIFIYMKIVAKLASKFNHVGILAGVIKNQVLPDRIIEPKTQDAPSWQIGAGCGYE